MVGFIIATVHISDSCIKPLQWDEADCANLFTHIPHQYKPSNLNAEFTKTSPGGVFGMIDARVDEWRITCQCCFRQDSCME